MRPLPRLMVAPNGARRGKKDHPALPITDDELIQTALACHRAGADGIHLHIRDADANHLLDATRYRSLLGKLETVVPDMYLQVTSEGAGHYSASEQRDMIRALRPAHVSVAMREMLHDAADWSEASAFYHWAAANGVEVQHILYSPEEVSTFVDAVMAGRIPGKHLLVQLVQGTYADGSKDAVDVSRYLEVLERAPDHSFDWMVCAFGKAETASLVQAAEMGGKARAGFENSLWNADGNIAADNAMRIREVDAALRKVGR